MGSWTLLEIRDAESLSGPQCNAGISGSLQGASIGPRDQSETPRGSGSAWTDGWKTGGGGARSRGRSHVGACGADHFPDFFVSRFAGGLRRTGYGLRF